MRDSDNLSEESVSLASQYSPLNKQIDDLM